MTGSFANTIANFQRTNSLSLSLGRAARQTRHIVVDNCTSRLAVSASVRVPSLDCLFLFGDRRLKRVLQELLVCQLTDRFIPPPRIEINYRAPTCWFSIIHGVQSS